MYELLKFFIRCFNNIHANEFLNKPFIGVEIAYNTFRSYLPYFKTPISWQNNYFRLSAENRC